MRGHRLSVFKCAAIAEIGGDAGRAEYVIADRRKMSVATACRRIIRHASACIIGCLVNTVALWPGLLRNRKPLQSSEMPAGSM